MILNDEILRKYAVLPTGNVADNNLSVPGCGVMDSGIKPVDPESHVLGRAFPVHCYPGDNLAMHQAIYAANPGDVLVLGCQGYSEAGHFGDVMATACLVRGIAGVIIDGSCRDAQDIKALGLPVFARGYSPRGTVKASPGALKVPVLCGGVQVNPGDIIVGDCDGVVVVPQQAEDTVFAGAWRKFQKEIQVVEDLKAGKSTLEIFGFDRLLH